MKKDYIFEDARIRILETGLLTRADFEQLLAEPSYASALAYLTDKGWGGPDAPKNAEALLEAEEKATWDLMEELLPGSHLLDTLRLSRDYQNLKAAVKQIYTGSQLDAARLFAEGGTIPPAEIRRAVEEQDLEKLPEAMAEAAAQAIEVLARTGDGQLCDNILDKAALAALLQAGEDAEDPVLKDYAVITAVSADIRSALRAARSGRDGETIRDMLVEVPGLDLSSLTEAALNDRQKVADYLNLTPYASLAPALSRSMSAFECACDDLMIERIRPQLYESEKPGPLAAYVIARENEITCVRLLLSGKQNGLPEDVLRESLRNSYV
ncbi:MAG: V-type ATPase subunit [Lachnospiraceae bacterium]|nr:V-type ATPase subunit [Lachnospiraceae bacterium]